MTLCVRTELFIEVIVKYKDKTHALETEIKAVLKQEEEEKHMRLSEMAISKARNIKETVLIIIM